MARQPLSWADFGLAALVVRCHPFSGSENPDEVAAKAVVHHVVKD
jgi:hypothetical protein